MPCFRNNFHPQIVSVNLRMVGRAEGIHLLDPLVARPSHPIGKTLAELDDVAP